MLSFLGGDQHHFPQAEIQGAIVPTWAEQSGQLRRGGSHHFQQLFFASRGNVLAISPFVELELLGQLARGFYIQASLFKHLPQLLHRIDPVLRGIAQFLEGAVILGALLVRCNDVVGEAESLSPIEYANELTDCLSRPGKVESQPAGDQVEGNDMGATCGAKARAV